jgi:hypothetical protein
VVEIRFPFDQSRGEARVVSEWGSSSVVSIIDAVEARVAEDGSGSPTLSIGSCSHRPAASTR